jgi:hypothetical protein
MTDFTVARFNEFRHLWDGSERGWVVLRGRRGGVPYNLGSKSMLLIDGGDELAEEVVRTMSKRCAGPRPSAVG